MPVPWLSSISGQSNLLKLLSYLFGQKKILSAPGVTSKTKEMIANSSLYGRLEKKKILSFQTQQNSPQQLHVLRNWNNISKCWREIIIELEFYAKVNWQSQNFKTLSD